MLEESKKIEFYYRYIGVYMLLVAYEYKLFSHLILFPFLRKITRAHNLGLDIYRDIDENALRFLRYKQNTRDDGIGYQ